MPTPKPLSANLVAEEPQVQAYSKDDWIAYLYTAEGWGAYEAGEDVPPDALREVITFVTEKGKGKNSNPKGNQKGKQIGNQKGNQKGHKKGNQQGNQKGNQK